MAAYQEVQKLALLFPPGTIPFEQVREAVLDVARYDVFNLGEVDARRRSAAARACSTGSKAKARRRRSSCGRSPKTSARSARSSPARRPASPYPCSCATRVYAALSPEPDAGELPALLPRAGHRSAASCGRGRPHDQRARQRRRLGRAPAARAALCHTQRPIAASARRCACSRGEPQFPS